MIVFKSALVKINYPYLLMIISIDFFIFNMLLSTPSTLTGGW